MKLQQIISQRSGNDENYAQPIIYEWEDDISNELGIPIVRQGFLKRILNRLSLKSTLLSTNKKSFIFFTNAKLSDISYNKENVIPCIIDFFIKDHGLKSFYQVHSKNKIILVSSPFDYDYLISKNCPIKVALMAYSLSDRYSIEGKKFDKKYDIVLTGRQDPLLYSFFQKYIEMHPEVSYVKRGKDINNDNAKTKTYYLNGKVEIGGIESRADYINLLSQGKVSLYGTQGIINDEETKGFYHITPAFLERVACGCHILAHYPECPDAKFFELEKFSKSVDSYEEFEVSMDKALSTPVNLKDYEEYLKKHYTSTRVHELKKILNNL